MSEVITPPPPPTARLDSRAGATRLVALAALALIVIGAFFLVDLGSGSTFIMKRRATAIGTMVVVASAVALATVAFQTVTNNQILTPSIMGFDRLYILIQTGLFFVLDAGQIAQQAPLLRFALNLLAMCAFSLMLYRWLLVGSRRTVHLLVLVGLVFGIFFSSVSTLLQRLMDPTQFDTLQDTFFASFSNIDHELLALGACLTLAAGAYLFRRRRVLDVIQLGPETATGLGVDVDRTMLRTLLAVTVLISTATALVGPTTFFGLLVAHLAYRLAPTASHALTLPMAALAGIIALVGGQLVLERVLDYGTALSVVIELVGGILFIVLLLRRSQVRS